jgi:hypothetical protein
VNDADSDSDEVSPPRLAAHPRETLISLVLTEPPSNHPTSAGLRTDDMAFQQSSDNIRLEGSTLHATCFKTDGTHVESALPLDTCIGNIDGVFKWGYKAFSQSARNIRLVNGVTLRAELSKPDRSWHDATLDLSAHIRNIEGVLTVDDQFA